MLSLEEVSMLTGSDREAAERIRLALEAEFLRTLKVFSIGGRQMSVTMFLTRPGRLHIGVDCGDSFYGVHTEPAIPLGLLLHDLGLTAEDCRLALDDFEATQDRTALIVGTDYAKDDGIAIDDVDPIPSADGPFIRRMILRDGGCLPGWVGVD